jgi:hypothetical protein
MVKVVYLFIRDVVENHSAKDASLVLFREYGGMPGSGRLLDYIDALPRPRH